MHFNDSIVLIILSTIVLLSHGFNVLSRALYIPSILLLIAFGVLLRSVSIYFHFFIPHLPVYLNFLGSIGLILIVLEGVLDLKVNRENLALIRKSFTSALVILLVSVGSITFLFYWWLKADLVNAYVNAIPLAVISSTVVIPSIHHLTRKKRDFLTYEAIFSDILGIMLFNLAIVGGLSFLHSLTKFAVQTFFLLVVSIVVSFGLLFLMDRVKIKTKSFMILSVLILIYSLGKLFNLSSLLLIFIFGLLLSNNHYFLRILRFKKTEDSSIETELSQFHLMVHELAFLIKTFFFITFGYSINIVHVWDVDVFLVGVPIIMILMVVRFIFLNYVAKTHVFPELFMAPKGLITVLLFYNIPPHMLIEPVDKGVILFVILATSLLMILGRAQKYEGTLNESI